MLRSVCEEFGFDEAAREKRLRLMGLEHHHHALAMDLQERVIRPNLAPIIREFYGHLTKEPAFWQVVRTKTELRSLERHQRQYLVTLGVDFDTEGYFETRLRVGQVHARVGLPLWLYQGAFAILSAAIRGHIPRDASGRELDGFLQRIVGLDQGLATEIFHQARMRRAIGELRSAEAREHEQRTLARRDSLTGLFRRDAAVEALDRAVQRARSDGQPLSVIMADLDNFKRVNDTHGHLVGDAVLRSFAARVATSLRDNDIVGRYGGEEFLFILDATPGGRATEIAERIRDQVASVPFVGGTENLRMTVSQGVAELTGGESVIELLSRADAALYDAKHEGRNCVRSRAA